MKVFLSYASEQRPVAESISVGLIQDKHETFFDRTSLPAGDGYHAQIRRAIADADLFVFLVSPESVEPDSYALTELNLARERWPDPSWRVLPVVVKTTPMEKIPAYLRAVTLLQPHGNLVAAVLSEVAKIAARRRGPLRWMFAGVGGLAVAAAAIGYALFPRPHPAACYLKAELRSSDPGSIAEKMMIAVTYGGATDTFLVAPDASAAIHVGPLKTGEERWTIALLGPDGSVVGSENLEGCSAGPRQIRVGDGFELIVSPRQ